MEYIYTRSPDDQSRNDVSWIVDSADDSGYEGDESEYENRGNEPAPMYILPDSYEECSCEEGMSRRE